MKIRKEVLWDEIWQEWKDDIHLQTDALSGSDKEACYVDENCWDEIILLRMKWLKDDFERLGYKYCLDENIIGMKTSVGAL